MQGVGDRYRVVLFRSLVRGIPSTTYATHGLYMYPARFIPHVVRFVIENYSVDGDWLFDPFAGYGTVAIEASLSGRNCVLWDLNPVTDILVRASTYLDNVSPSDLEIDWSYGDRFIPRWDNIFYWHPIEFLEALSRAWGYYHYSVDERLKPLMAIPLLKVTRYFSYSDEGIAKLYRSRRAVEKVRDLLGRDWRRLLEKMYREKTIEVIERIRRYQELRPKRIMCIVRAGVDSLEQSLEWGVDVLITSPPYLQAQEYIRSFKLELAWLGYTGEQISGLAKLEIPYRKPCRAEIESRLYREYRERIAKQAHKKLLELYDTYFTCLAHLLNKNHGRVRSTIAIFVAPVKIRTIRIPIDEILREHLESLGWRHEATLIDTIMQRRLFKTWTNPATGLPDERTITEHLLIMRKN